MSSIRVGDYLDHHDPAVRAHALNAQSALARLLRAIRDTAEPVDLGDDLDFEPPADVPDQLLDDPATDDETPPRRRHARAGAHVPAAPGEAQAIREWAHAHGIDVNPRGSVRSGVVALYRAAHPTSGGEDL